MAGVENPGFSTLTMTPGESKNGWLPKPRRGEMMVISTVLSGKLIVDSTNGVERWLREASVEYWCRECGDFELERIGYNYCDSPNDLETYGPDGMCCACDDCGGCWWACPDCGHGRGVA